MRGFPKFSERLKNSLRGRRNSANPAVRYAVRAIGAAYAFLREGKALATDPIHRSYVPVRLLNASSLHQAVGDTAMDRFPAMFGACRAFFGGRQDLNILSFGCSTGEEVLTLRRYFETAFITGAEINRRSLALCRRLDVDDRVAFVHSKRDTIRQRGPFDAIFCMAVLQRVPSTVRGPFPASLKSIYPFERFDEQITEFDLLLKTNGLLVVHGKAYAFNEASAAGNYAPLATAPAPQSDGPKYDRNSQRVEGGAALGSIFVKVK